MSAVYVVRTVVRREGDADFNAWQDDEHLDALLALPGYLGAQRFQELGGPGSYLNVWRLTDPTVFGGPLHEQASHTPWFWALRPYCTVSVDFGVEVETGTDRGPALWRRGVAGLVVDRLKPGVELSAEDVGALAEGSGVAEVVRLDPLPGDPAADRRSLPAAPVLLTYVTADPGGVRLPGPPAGARRQTYRALGPYVPR